MMFYNLTKKFKGDYTFNFIKRLEERRRTLDVRLSEAATSPMQDSEVNTNFTYKVKQHQCIHSHIQHKSINLFHLE